MTFEEIRDIQISNLIGSSTELLSAVKNCLAIVATSTAKDIELSILISGAVEDLNRNQINVTDNLSNGLIQSAIVMYVKGHFSLVDERQKELALKSYHQIVTNLSLSQSFLLEETE